MKIKRKLKRKISGNYCECGCGQEVKWNKSKKKYNRFIFGHSRKGKAPYNKGIVGAFNHSDKTKKKMSDGRQGKNNHMFGKEITEEHRKNLSLSHMGYKASDETKLKMSLTRIKGRNDGYCDAWADDEYKQDCKKDYCESCRAKEIKTITKDGKLCSNLLLHHIDFDKKNCHPDNLQTLCRTCHMRLHHLFNRKIGPKYKRDIMLVNAPVKYCGFESHATGFARGWLNG